MRDVEQISRIREARQILETKLNETRTKVVSAEYHVKQAERELSTATDDLEFWQSEINVFNTRYPPEEK